MSELFSTDFGTMLAAIEEARLVDFVRYVNRQQRERGLDLTEQSFKDGWLIVLGGYAEQAARTQQVYSDE